MIKKLLIFIGLMSCFYSISKAEIYNSFAFETVTVTTSAATTLTSATYNPQNTTGNYSRPAKMAFITIETDEVRWRDDGTSPTRTVGHKLELSDTYMIITGEQSIEKFKVIGSGSASASLKVTYFN